MLFIPKGSFRIKPTIQNILIMNKLVSDIMNDNIVRINKDNRVGSLLQYVPNKSNAHIMVNDNDGKFIGVVTQNNLMMYFVGLLDAGLTKEEREQEISSTTVEALITLTPVILNEKQHVSQVFKGLEANMLDVIPVVDENDKAVGIVTLENLLLEQEKENYRHKNTGFNFNNHRVSSHWMQSHH